MKVLSALQAEKSIGKGIGRGSGCNVTSVTSGFTSEWYLIHSLIIFQALINIFINMPCKYT